MYVPSDGLLHRHTLQGMNEEKRSSLLILFYFIFFIDHPAPDYRMLGKIHLGPRVVSGGITVLRS